MKTIQHGLIALALILSACGGGGSSNSPEPDPTPVAPPPSVPPTEPDSLIEGKIVVGIGFNCMLNGGVLDCWGRNDAGQADVPQEVANVTDVDVGANFGCAIHSNNQLTCWGDSNDDKLLIPNSIVNPTQIAAGEKHACVLDQNGVVCWGNNDNQQLDVPEIDAQVDKLVAGWDTSCAVVSGTPICWGDSDAAKAEVPMDLTNVTDIAISKRAICAIGDNTVQCWGSNALGELVVPSDMLSPAGIAAHEDGFCALQEGMPSCWGGLDAYGELTDSEELAGLTQIDALGYHLCGITDSEAVCWGSNIYGERIAPGELGELREISAEGDGRFCFLGTDATRCVGSYFDKRDSVGETQYFGPVEKILVSDFGHGCTLSGNTLDCFGRIDGATFDEPEPITDAVDFRLGIGIVCYLNTQQTIHCFGEQSRQEDVPFTFLDGQENVSMFDMGWFGGCYARAGEVNCDFNDLISDASEIVEQPEQFFDLRYLGIGFFHACALEGNQTICWGADSSGRLEIPDQISDVQNLVVGPGHTCAVDSQSGLTCWGAANDEHDPTVPEDFIDASLVDIYLETTCAQVGANIQCWSGRADQEVASFKIRLDPIEPN